MPLILALQKTEAGQSEFEATLLLYRASFRTGPEAREIPSPKTKKQSEVIANVCNVSTK